LSQNLLVGKNFSFINANFEDMKPNKKAQLSLGKTHYSLYTSCCITDLQGHPKLMIYISSEKASATFY